MREFISARDNDEGRGVARRRLTAGLVSSPWRRILLRKKRVIVPGAIALALYLGNRGVSFSEAVVALGALILAVVVFSGEWGIQFGFALWVLTLALGYRTVRLTSNLPIHPAEILIWVLFLSICLHRRLVSTATLSLPLWMWLMLPFWLLGWWPLISGSAYWDQMLNEFRNFVLLIPLMIVATVVLRRRHTWRLLLWAFFAAGTWIAILGILEFYVVGVARLVPAFMTSTNAGTIEGFERAMFSFWGGPMATFICALALPIGIVAVRWWQTAWQRAAIIASTIAQIVAVYIGGYRSIWLLVVIEILLACFLSLKRQRVAVAAVCVLVTVAGYQFVPQSGSQRALSGIEALRGHATDSSAKDRINRARSAFEQMVAAPLGSGWSASGWVHSDFVQVGANLGLLGGMIFLGGYLFALWRLFRRVLVDARNEDEGDLGVTLLLSYFSAGGILATQGVDVLPQLVLPVWFVWVLVEVWLTQRSDAPVLGEAAHIVFQSESLTPDSWWPAPLSSREGVKQ